MPGLVDLHTHLREPGREDAETVQSGTLAAARGGFTAVLAMANTTPVTDTAEAAAHVAALGARDGSAQVVPVGAVSKGLDGVELAELGLMARSSAGVRVFSDDGHCVSDARLMRRALEYVRAFDGVIAQHAQDPQLAGAAACCHEGEISGKLGLPGWPAAAEASVVARDVQIAELTRSRLHICHVSCAETVDVIRWAKQRGINVTAEVAPHHLMLTTSEVLGYDPTYKVNPPLRPERARRGASGGAGRRDHRCGGHRSCPPRATRQGPRVRRSGIRHARSRDRAGRGRGDHDQPGLLSWTDVAKRMSIMPAHIARLTDQGRPLAVGEPANVVLVDPAARQVIDRNDSASLSRNNPWHGRELPDPVVATIWAGRITYRRA